jgi:hypothetical protein
MQEPALRRPEYWWLAVVPLLVYLVLAQALRENYPFSHYPMYANPTSRPLTFQFVTDGEGNPVKVGSLTGVTPSQVGKTYGERKKEHPSEQDAAMDVLKFLRKQDTYRKGPAMPDRIRLVETSIGFKGNQFVETNRVLAEHQLP